MSLRNAPGEIPTRAGVPLPSGLTPPPPLPKNGDRPHDEAPTVHSASEHNLRLLIATQEFNEFRILDRIYTEHPELGIKTIGWCDNGINLYQAAIDGDADVVIADPETRSFQHEDVQRLWIYPKKPIVTIAAVPPQSGLANTMKQLGAVDLVTRPLTERSAHELVAKCHVGVQDALRYRASIGYIPQIDSRTAQVIAARGWQQGVMVIWGPKGGVGKTMVACNLAVALGVIGNRRTVLVDANMTGGNDHHHFYQSIPQMQLGKNISALTDRAMLHSRYGYMGANNREENPQLATERIEKAVRSKLLQSNGYARTYRFVVPEVGFLLSALANLAQHDGRRWLDTALKEFQRDPGDPLRQMTLALGAWHQERLFMRYISGLLSLGTTVPIKVELPSSLPDVICTHSPA